jgi:hypothetical protein
VNVNSGKNGVPKNEGISDDVHENKGLEIIPPMHVQKSLKISRLSDIA